MLLCGMLEKRTRKQQLKESVGKDQKYHFQLYCLTAVGGKVSTDDKTPSWIFQTWKLEAVLSPFRRLLGSCFLGGSSCTLLSLQTYCYPFLFTTAETFFFFDSLPFMIMEYFTFPLKFYKFSFACKMCSSFF